MQKMLASHGCEGIVASLETPTAIGKAMLRKIVNDYERHRSRRRKGLPSVLAQGHGCQEPDEKDPWIQSSSMGTWQEPKDA
jgi:hypothetical protein